jgi:aspartate carbamoyltransferase regulatory subunit
MANAKNFAEQGRKYCNFLYNEVNRLKRLKKMHPERFDEFLMCGDDNCTQNSNRKIEDGQ